MIEFCLFIAALGGLFSIGNGSPNISSGIGEIRERLPRVGSTMTTKARHSLSRETVDYRSLLIQTTASATYHCPDITSCLSSLKLETATVYGPHYLPSDNSATLQAIARSIERLESSWMEQDKAAAKVTSKPR
ncbi:hypothetical protein BGW36DRAFT_365520 [Talaromyces proteolyticus]|uniref:Uncharacterized protein n=1 Tax=Talaromyces proteolyticus TaxID=1131652 RepID=A0AAD4PTM8_9EURO|nr:uncharacterized protein BGW36DRAFT_365520 [Talaromyces proteolyticus]KAH8688984.1 hypothetical protein BGW36DRAFT_365520 [Talaromyces proteolyticus]